MAENLGVKNYNWDKEDGYVVSDSRNLYGSYFYLPEDTTINLLDKIRLHGRETTIKLDGGVAAHLNLDEHLTADQYKTILNYAGEVGCSYFTFNIPNTICNDCGEISKHHLDHCEYCSSTNVDYLTRIIGYLKRISNFSEPRQVEAHRRHYHENIK